MAELIALSTRQIHAQLTQFAVQMGGVDRILKRPGARNWRRNAFFQHSALNGTIEDDDDCRLFGVYRLPAFWSGPDDYG